MECAVPAGCMRLSPCYSTSCGRQPAWKLVRSTARHFASAPLTISQLERSLAVHRRHATDSAPNLSKLGHLRRFYPALTGPIMVKALLPFGLLRARPKAPGRPPCGKRPGKRSAAGEVSSAAEEIPGPGDCDGRP